MRQELIDTTLAKFQEQFAWVPKVENASGLLGATEFAMCGMGGSGLAPSFIKAYWPHQVIVHRDYGLPTLPADFSTNGLVIACSYSGTTEETIDSAKEALAGNLPLAVICTGGDLLELAKEKKLPYVEIPKTGLQPRMAVGYAILAIAAVMRDEVLLKEIRDIGLTTDPFENKEFGISIAEQLKGYIPWIYASAKNGPLAYFCKIKFNENSKIPSIWGEVPELCHNDLCGFDVAESTRELIGHVHVVMFEDGDDHPRVQKRFAVMKELLEARGIKCMTVPLKGRGFKKLLYGSLIMDWASIALGEMYNVPVSETPLIQELKKKLASK